MQRFAKKIHFGKGFCFYFRQNWTAVTIPGLIFCINMSVSEWNTVTHSLVLPKHIGRQLFPWDGRSEQAIWSRLHLAEHAWRQPNSLGCTGMTAFSSFTRFSKTCFICSLPPSLFFTVLFPFFITKQMELGTSITYLAKHTYLLTAPSWLNNRSHSSTSLNDAT